MYDWSNPISLGLFLLMAGGAIVLFSIGVAVVTGKAKIADINVLKFFKL